MQTSADRHGASLDAIQSHYDVGNAFYALWLDAPCVYSAAMWGGDTKETLESAQTRKLDFHAEQARATNAARILEVGCGWGAMLKRLVGPHRVQRAVGLTLSLRQFEHVLAFRDEKIDVRLENWQDHSPSSPYDAIISIGAFEHFAKPGLSSSEKIEAYRAFFRSCHGWLAEGGYLSLQTIVHGSASTGTIHPFIADEIFPESDLPRIWEIAAAAEGVFEVVSMHNHPEDYERTLNQWRRRLRARRQEAIALVDEATVARYEKYLNFSIVSFHIGTTGLTRWTCRRVGAPRAPRT